VTGAASPHYSVRSHSPPCLKHPSNSFPSLIKSPPSPLPGASGESAALWAFVASPRDVVLRSSSRTFPHPSYPIHGRRVCLSHGRNTFSPKGLMYTYLNGPLIPPLCPTALLHLSPPFFRNSHLTRAPPFPHVTTWPQAIPTVRLPPRSFPSTKPSPKSFLFLKPFPSPVPKGSLGNTLSQQRRNVFGVFWSFRY